MRVVQGSGDRDEDEKDVSRVKDMPGPSACHLRVTKSLLHTIIAVDALMK